METIEQQKSRELVEDLIDAKEKPRGLYHISEVIQEILGPDILLSALAAPYETPVQYHNHGNNQGGTQ